MANSKISALASLTGAGVAAATDVLPIVDVSAGAAGSKKITVEELWKAFSTVSATSAMAAITGANLVVATDLLPIVDVSAGASGSKTVTIEELFKSASLTPYLDSLVMNKATGKGIKVDTAAPTYGYHDITGQIHVRGSGAADPSWTTFRGAINAFEFSATVEKECWIEFHIPHDYAPGTDVYLHTHWSNAAAVPNTGNVVWGFDYSTARGYNQEVFPAPTTITVTQASHATRYMHQIAETAAITIANLEPDSLMQVRVYRKAADAADTCTDTAFLFMADMHYQSTGIPTKQKNGPAFYT